MAQTTSVTKGFGPRRSLLASGGVLAAFLSLGACTTSDFGGSSGKEGANPPATSSNNAVDAAAVQPSPTTADAAANGSALAPTTNAGASSCSSGCCPSQHVAFVDCSGGSTPAPLNKGNFNITPVACSAVQSNGIGLSGYDTIFYYGPIDEQATSLPAGIDAALNGGSKVIAIPTTDSGGILDHAFYGLTLENNIEFASTIGTATVDAVNSNSMSAAFSQSRYANATLSFLQFLGPFLLVDSSTFTPELEAHWCSDLTARSVLQVQLTTFHSFLLDDAAAARRGLLILSTMTLPNDQTGFDFTEPFLAAHLSQKWNRSGNSAQCGLPCNATSAGGSGGFTRPTGVGKPVIYLYPPKEQVVSVKLDFKGELVTTYPKYDPAKQGWKVRARPDGQMINLDDQQEYSYIYWNGTSQAFKPSLDEGFVVKGSDTRKFLQTTLAKLGLNPREANDMIVYWLPYMERHAYNQISFVQKAYTDIARLSIEPKPDALLRVFMVFKGLDKPVTVKPQTLQPFQRHGFTAVEWGGSELDGDWHIIK